MCAALHCPAALAVHDLFVAPKQRLIQSIDVVEEFGGGPHGLSMRVSADVYKADVGHQARTGRRQSIPSSSIDGYACVTEPLPLFTWGQTKLPRLSRFGSRL